MRAGRRLILTVLLALTLLPAIALAEPSSPLAPADKQEIVIGEHPDGILFTFTEPNADTYRIDVLISASPSLGDDGRFAGGIVAMGGTSETTTPGFVNWTLPREEYAPDAGDADMPPGTYYWETDSQQPCGDGDICHVYGPVRSFNLVTKASGTPSGTAGTGGRTSGSGPGSTSSSGTSSLTPAQKAAAVKKAKAKAKKKKAAAKKATRCKTLIRQKKLAKAKRLGCRVPKKKAPAKRSST